MNQDPARAYRESAVRGASPVGLIVVLYEEIIRSIRKAQRALALGKIEDRSNALGHAIQVVGHLQTVLDFEKGGALARELATFYTLARAKLLELNVRPQERLIEDLAAEFATMKAAWQRVEIDLATEDGISIPNSERQAIAASSGLGLNESSQPVSTVPL
jgi:flagellar protein FliS